MNSRLPSLVLYCTLAAFSGDAVAAVWPPGGPTPSPISARMRLPGARFVPSSRRWNMIWADQIIPENTTPAKVRFAAEHYAATQKIFTSQTALFRASNPNFLVTIYHLATALNPEHNDDCPDPKSNHGTGNIGVVTPTGYVGEYANYFRPWLATQSIGEGSARYEVMFQHYDTVDMAHRVWHQDPAWLMNLENADWEKYLGDACIGWMRGTGQDGCFFDVAVEANASLYNPKSGNPAPRNFDWWAPPHGPASEAAQTTDRAAFSTWMNKRYRDCFQDIYKRFHTDSVDYLVIPNTDQMVTTVYDPVWTDGDASGETIDGAMMEGFGNYRGQDMWLTLDRGVRHITGRGKILVAQFYGVDSTERLRRTAMYMLIKNENSFINILNADGVEWYPEYEIDLGNQHRLPRTLDSLRIAGQSWQSVWARDYDRGRILCNTSDAAMHVNVPSIGQWARVVPHGGGKVVSDGTPLPQSIAYEPVSGMITIPASGGVILMRLDSSTAVLDAIRPANVALTISPNPVATSASIRFSLTRPSHARMKLTDAIGREVQIVTEGSFGVGEHCVTLNDADRFAVGVYYIHLATSDGVRVERVNIVR